MSDVVCRTCTDECPGDLECRNGYCMAPDTVSCSASGNGGGGGAGSAAGGSAGRANASGTGGTGERGGSSAAGAHGGGKDGVGGSSRGGAGAGMHGGGTSGAAEPRGGSQSLGGADDGGAGGGCEITTDVAPACSGREFTAELALPCGTAPFHWRITQGGDGLVLDAHGSAATLSGTLAEAGDYPVTVDVTDASGTAQASLLLHVRDTPVVTTASLPVVCASELYAVPLAAEGGDGTNYSWSSDVPAESGLVVADGKLGGLFTPTGGSELDVTFTVESDGCVSVPVTLPLERAAPADCPIIEAVSGTGDLPAPCRGNAYGADLTALGPNGVYQWEQFAVPTGLAFDTSTQHLSGALSAPGALTVDVTEAGHTIERTFELSPRDTCWLAYVAPVNGVARLGLFDPVTKGNRTFPTDPNADPVTDFQFSPDGRFLVYRTGVSTAAGHLTLVEMPDPVEHPLSFDQASHYAWSDDASTLAVAFSNSDGPALGGVDVAHPAAGAGGTTYPELGPLAVSVDSALVWYAGTHVAFSSAVSTSLWPVRAATREAGGFGELVFSDAKFGSSSELRPGVSGVYVVPSDADFITFYGLEFFGDPNRITTPNGDEFQGIPHDDFAISGTGNYVAGVLNRGLEVFTAGNPSSPDQYPVPDVPAPGATPITCDAVLAWAPAADRLACGVATGGPDDPAQIAVADVSTDTTGVTTAASTVVHGVSGYPALFPSGRQRLFSRDGSRFAFTTANRLSVAQIAIGGAAVVMQHDFLAAPGADDAVVAFSPAGHRILEHRGDVLSLFDVTDASGTELVVDQDLPPAPACQESVRAAAGVFCGSERVAADFAWSQDAATVAHATASGALRVVDLSRVESGLLDYTTVTDDCPGCVSGQSFAFQP